MQCQKQMFNLIVAIKMSYFLWWVLRILKFLKSILNK